MPRLAITRKATERSAPSESLRCLDSAQRAAVDSESGDGPLSQSVVHEARPEDPRSDREVAAPIVCSAARQRCWWSVFVAHTPSQLLVVVKSAALTQEPAPPRKWGAAFARVVSHATFVRVKKPTSMLRLFEHFDAYAPPRTPRLCERKKSANNPLAMSLAAPLDRTL